MSASTPEATKDHSSSPRPSRRGPERPSTTVLALVGLALLGALLTLVSAFMNVLEVTTGQATLEAQGFAGGRKLAMVLLAVAAVAMALGALRRARPAMAALAAIGVVILVIAFTIDLPDALDEGLYGERYEAAEAKPATGFFVETAGGMLLVLSGGLLLLSGLGGGGTATRRAEAAGRARGR
jgi:hypothetical protein